MEGASAKLEVAEAYSLAAQDAEDHQDTDNQEDDNRCNLNDGEPIFGLSITA
ncbi:hypothetical protein D3C71_2232320 [compost metagenome]